MMEKQHVIFSTVTGVGTYLLLNQIAPQFTSAPIFYFGGTILGSLMPDIDTDQSTIGRSVPHIARLINKLFGHRTITHDVLLWMIVAIIHVYFQPNSFGFWFGYLTHLFLDCFTVNGIMWGYFLHKKYTKSHHRNLMMLEHGFIHLLPYHLRMKSSAVSAVVFTYVLSVLIVYGIYVFSNYIGINILSGFIT